MKIKMLERITWQEAIVRMCYGKYCTCTHYFGSSHESTYLYHRDSMDVIRSISTNTMLYTEDVMDCDDILEGKWNKCELE